MTLLEALEHVVKHNVHRHGVVLKCLLLCGFSPLHLKTFLHAELIGLILDKRIVVEEGLFDDVRRSLMELRPSDFSFVVLALEWSDFDPRLGLRNSGHWLPGEIDDILGNVRKSAIFFRERISLLSNEAPFSISLPSLPLPPVHFGKSHEGNAWSFAIDREISSFAESMASLQNVRIVSPQGMLLEAPLSVRRDPKGDIAYGFPYTLEFTAVLGRFLAELAANVPSMKGIVTDLDGTLWRGILGDDGVDGVSWDLDHGSQMHALYQKVLHSMANAGTLLAVASKNDAALVEQAFLRHDILLPRDSVFPLEAHWESKISSIHRILKVWNIGEDAAVFIDDNPHEIEEVRTAFPRMKCLRFPSDDPGEILELLFRLRDLCGKSTIGKEDAVRLSSIRNGSDFADTATEDDPDRYEGLLRESNARISASFLKNPVDPRALELINKTNQFNMNGRRRTQGEWFSYLKGENTLLLVVSYNDRFGSLGKISVLTGEKTAKELCVTNWVMSCRAFGRRIEYQVLRLLFEKTGVDAIRFSYEPTERNMPFLKFINTILQKNNNPMSDNIVISKKIFDIYCPNLYHSVEVG